MIAEKVTDNQKIENQNNPKPESRENRDFVMLYRQFISQVADLGLQDVQALRVLLFLVKHMDTRNALACPMSLMSDMLKLSRQTISGKLKYLQENGWVQILKLGRQNVYIINPEVVWTSYDYQKQFCRFDATVMLSLEDNWAIVGNKNRVSIRHVDKDVLKAFAEKEYPDEYQASEHSDRVIH